MKSQRLKSRFRDKGHPNIFYLPYIKPNRFKYYLTHQGTSRDQFKLPIYQTCNHIRLSKSNLKPNRFKYYATHQGISRDNSNFQRLAFYRIQNQILSRQGHSNTSILPNTKSNRLTYHVSHQGTTSNISFIKLVGIQTKISFSRQGSIQYFHFTEFKTKQVHISCLHQGASRDKFRHLSNFKKRVSSII